MADLPAFVHEYCDVIDNTQLTDVERKELARKVCIMHDIGRDCKFCGLPITEDHLETYVTADYKGGIAHKGCWDAHAATSG